MDVSIYVDTQLCVGGGKGGWLHILLKCGTRLVKKENMPDYSWHSGCESGWLGVHIAVRVRTTERSVGRVLRGRLARPARKSGLMLPMCGLWNR